MNQCGPEKDTVAPLPPPPPLSAINLTFMRTQDDEKKISQDKLKETIPT